MTLGQHKKTFIDRAREKYGRVMKGSGTVDDFQDFGDKYKKELPVRYFLLETLPDFLVWSKTKITKPWNRLKMFVFYRTLGRFHVVKTGLAPGYHDKDAIMLHANFSLLVDFVEIEYARCPTKEEAKANKRLRRIRWKARFIPAYHLIFRDAESGVKELEERIRLGQMDVEESLLNQGELNDYVKSMMESVENDKIVLELYRWWTEIRPKQWEDLESIDPSEHLKNSINPEDQEKIGGLGILSKRLAKKYPEAFNKYHDAALRKYNLEKLLHDEDQEMLMKLIEIRRKLWT